MDLNSLSLTGRLARDPDLRVTPSGKTVASFRIASNGFGDKVVWIDVNVWGRQAENVTKFLAKGSRVAVKGRLEPLREYQKRDGTTGASLEMTADDVAFLDPKNSGDASAPVSRPATPPATPATAPAPATTPPAPAVDDIPF